eukprot:m.25060 g.25060  ORF g.25060 m.25060 type:complete len:199 (-) comp14858_c0_seq1:389-985(-)
MEIIKTTSALLCNHEVYNLVSEYLDFMQTQPPEQAKRNNRNEVAKTSGIDSINTVLYEVKKHLSWTPAVVQTETIVIEFMEAMKEFNLTKAEKLQLLNSRPTSEVLLLRIIEEGEERLNEKEQEEILAIIEKILPPAPGVEEPADEGAEEYVDEDFIENEDENVVAAADDNEEYYGDEDENFIAEKNAKVDSDAENDD